MYKRILSLILCLTIFITSFSLCIPVKADSLFNTIYDDFDYSDTISQHKSFIFTDKGGNRHPVVRMGNTWLAGFGTGKMISNDNDLNYYLSWYSYKGYNGSADTGDGVLSAIGGKIGAMFSSASNLMEKVLLNVPDVEIDYNDDNGLTILSDSVDKLRKQLKEQYYNSIGLYVLESSGTPQELLSSVKTLYEHEEDFQSDYADIKDRDYVFACKDYKGVSLVFRMFFDDEPSYIYCNGKEIFDYDSNISSNLVVINKSNDIIDRNYVKYYYRHSNIKPENMGAAFSNINNEISNFHLVIHDNRYSYGSVYFYSDNNKTINIFKSYEALYNFQHGSQTAYVSSKIEETGKDIQISIDDMNTNISNKMDELIDSINKKKDGMSSDELQNAIDKGLESISGKIDDIGNNTEQTNNKLDDLISIMREQNIILSDILGVTNRIADSVSDDKEDKNYTINDIVPHFNKCFTAVKNMVLFGTSSFDDTGTQSVISVDNDVGIAVYADDVEENVKDYHNGILGKFPFSVPYQLYEWLQVLQCEPKTPEFKYNYGYLVGKKDSEETIIQFDLSNYNDWANVSRSFLKLSFTLALAVGVYRKFKGEI
jgi:hypothetical protein